MNILINLIENNKNTLTSQEYIDVYNELKKLNDISTSYVNDERDDDESDESDEDDTYDNDDSDDDTTSISSANVVSSDDDDSDDDRRAPPLHIYISIKRRRIT